MASVVVPLQPQWVADLTVGQWYEIPGTVLSSVAPSPVPPGNPVSKVDAWTSFVVDTRTSKVYSVANGGHNDYAGNEVDALTLEVESPFWTEVLASTPAAQIPQPGDGSSYYGDGRPVSRHTYYGVTLDTANDRIMLFGGGLWYANGGGHLAVDSYQIAANVYNPDNTHPDVTSFASGAAVSADPTTGDVYCVSSFNLRKWTRSANAWSDPEPSGTKAWGTEAMSAIDTTRGRMLVIGGIGTDDHFYTIGSNSWSAAGINGANAADIASLGEDGGGGGALVYVAEIDKFLVRAKASGGTVYQINPTTFEVTTFATTGGASVPATTNGPYNKFLYVPRLGGAIYVPTYAGNSWFLRLH